MQILKMHNLTQNYRINLAARGILQSHGTLRHMTDESNNGIGTEIDRADRHSDRTSVASPPKVSRKSSTLWAKFFGVTLKMVTVPALGHGQ